MLVLQQIKEQITRRRALLIAPVAFAGLVAVSSRKDSDDNVAASVGEPGEVTLVQFSDSGENLGTAQLKRVVRSSTEWRKQLTREQFSVTRQKGTDLPFTGTYYKTHAAGIFRCVCCENALFRSETKFDSGTGWPSFWAPIAEENIRTHKDTSMFMERVEVLCKRCDAHLGHVFNDGPEPTYLRYCMNESALHFISR